MKTVDTKHLYTSSNDPSFDLRFVDGLITFDIVFKVDDSIKDDSFNMKYSIDRLTYPYASDVVGVSLSQVARDLEIALNYLRKFFSTKNRNFINTVECNSDMKYSLIENLKKVYLEIT